MSWSYSGNPASSPLDECRFLVGDTNTAAQLVSDEEINYNIALVYGTTPPASGNFLPAAYAADGIAAKSARSVDKSVGDLHLSYSQQAKSFRDLANVLRRRATLKMVPIYVGGLSLAEKATNEADLDMPQPAFKVGGMNKVSTESQPATSTNIP